MSEEDISYLNVRETAARLGVHENTIRNWAKKGILQSAKVPGAQGLRFDERDIERLQRGRGKSAVSVRSERITIGPELVDGAQLNLWPDVQARDAQGQFPELVRRLLVATPGVTGVSVRAGDGVAMPGWDGHAEAEGVSFLPSGRLVIEMGVGKRPSSKAADDFRKRASQGSEADRKQTSFVFMTPRRWRGAQAWEKERRAEAVFRDVRVLDADDIEGWLQSAPLVHHWISEHLGRSPADALTAEKWWKRLSGKTDPALPVELFLAGRDAERDRLLAFIDGPPGVLTLKAAWLDDALGFICAALSGRPLGSDPPSVLLVRTPEVWDRVVREHGVGALVPLFADADVGAAVEHGHHVLLPVAGEQVAREISLVLHPPGRREAAEALEGAGVDADDAYHLAALARRSMPALVRSLSKDPRFQQPPWAQPPHAATFAPLVLVEAWTTSEADLSVISKMTGKEWPVVEAELQRWAQHEDRPCLRSGGQWHFASPEEALLLLAPALTSSDLSRWHDVAVDVLLEPDPRLDLAEDERPMAAIVGAVRAHSGVLRAGVAQGIALVGSADDATLADGKTAADHARSIVTKVLGEARSDASARTWCSIADVLPRLAEASPDAFLAAVHDDLDAEAPVLVSLFQDGPGTSTLFSSSPHTSLLWALETLCWSSEFLPEAARALARLDAIDPGGQLSNRPLESLSNVLVGWIRHTGAPLEVRAAAVEAICEQMPDTGWKMLLALWPSSHAVSSPPAQPRFRDWKPDSRSVSVAVWVEFIEHLVRLAIRLAHGDPRRIAELGERLAPLPPAERETALRAIEEGLSDADSMSAEERVEVWERLRKETARHRRFPEADWSMDGAALERLEAIMRSLRPGGAEHRAFLFDWRPDLPGLDDGDDRKAYEAKLLELREQALTEAMADSSVEGVEKLARRSRAPSQLGWTLGGLSPEPATSQIIPWLDSDDPALREAASAWAGRRTQEGGSSWLRQVLDEHSLTDAQALALAVQVPPAQEFWDVIEGHDQTLADAYWDHVRPPFIDEPNDLKRAVLTLVDHGRPWIAIDLVAMDLHRDKNGRRTTSLNAAALIDILDAALKADPRQAQAQSVGYELGLILDHLDDAGYDQDALARYEFLFFRLLEGTRGPRALFRALAAEPSLFVELVARVYRGKSEKKRDLDEQQSALATHAWHVLHEWQRLPGLDAESGEIDHHHLEGWVQEARLRLSELDRADIGDEEIGRVLAASPPGKDGLWPAEPVRDIVERIGSTSIESGLHSGRVNSRGITSRDVYAGGVGERKLAEEYRNAARALNAKWPRTSRVLRGLADTYEAFAAREDAEAQAEADAG
ncbi:MAG: helix-turn-helix domain-containing protein [Solirubrobacterales bacterium]|nr:helix-turn-helix domain-containing protein [Solirubrobacterales bacterium]